MVEVLITAFVTALILFVVVPITLVWLLVRQVRRSRTMQRLRVVRGLTPVPAPRQRGGGEAVLSRPWSLLAADAAAARERFVRVTSQVAKGPLRSSLVSAVHEVDAAVADARRLAREGSDIDRAYREVCAALVQQRRRSRRGPAPAGELVNDLNASIRAQQASARRLEESRRQTLCQLQLVVARLHELTAHALEITTVPQLPHGTAPAVSIADRLAALREATAEVQALDLPVAL